MCMIAVYCIIVHAGLGRRGSGVMIGVVQVSCKITRVGSQSEDDCVKKNTLIKFCIQNT